MTDLVDLSTVLSVVLGVLALGLSVVVLLSKLLALAPSRAGAVFVFTNVVYETFTKKLGWGRWPLDLATPVVLGGLWWLAAGPVPAMSFVVVYSVVWGVALAEEVRMLRNAPGRQNREMGRGSVDRRFGGWVPAPDPDLVVLLHGPVLRREKTLDLGDWPQGHQQEFELLVLNPTILRPSRPLQVKVESCSPGRIEVAGGSPVECPAPSSGDLARFRFCLTATTVTSIPTEVSAIVVTGGFRRILKLKVRSVFDPASVTIRSAEINRWKGGASAGFAWRGDMDMYDPTTFQSIDGLRHTLGLCRRWRVASSMYLSGRLSLVEWEHERFCAHLGVDRKTEEIPDFIRFMREEVQMTPILDFPYEPQSGKPYALELGNHMYLHYDTHAAMDEGNNWKNMAWMEDGRYPWQSEETGSFAEQRDNALHNIRVIEETLGVTVRSWGVPGRGFDSETARAVEAAGIEVGSDTDASAWINVMELPAPHHPVGTTKLVEMTKKYPGDPDNVYKVAMLKYWMQLARRTHRTFVFMAHQHLLRYEGTAGTAAAETVLRYALEGCHGDFYVSTVFGLGWYWDRVLCPEHRQVVARASNDARALEVVSTCDAVLDDVPVEVTFSSGQRLLVLVSVPAGSTAALTLLDVGAA